MWLKLLFEFLKWLLSVAATPSALIIVWFYNFRPFQFLSKFVGNGSELQHKIDSLPPATVGAVDVALTVLIFNIIAYFFKKIEKPVSIKTEIIDAYTELPNVGLDFDVEKVGQGNPYPLKLKVAVKISPLFESPAKYLC